jgi:hypothetical protein
MDVISHFKDTTPAVESLIRNQLLSGFSKATQDFYIHLHLSHCYSQKYGRFKSGFVPMSYNFLKSNFRTAIDKKELASLSKLELLIM